MTQTPNGLTYAQAGVNIDAGNALIDKIKPLAKATRRPGADAALGGFGALFDLKAAGYSDPLLVSTTDGVGTKLKIAIETGRHDTVGIDLVGMCVNDLLAQGAEPLLFWIILRPANLMSMRPPGSWPVSPPDAPSQAVPWSAVKRQKCQGCIPKETMTSRDFPWGLSSAVPSCQDWPTSRQVT